MADLVLQKMYCVIMHKIRNYKVLCLFFISREVLHGHEVESILEGGLLDKINSWRGFCVKLLQAVAGW